MGQRARGLGLYRAGSLLATALSVALLHACTSSDGVTAPAADTTSTSRPVVQETSTTVELAAGGADTLVPFVMPARAASTIDVELEMPPDWVLTADITTRGGRRLIVADEARMSDGCRTVGPRPARRCVFHLPVLPAEPPGEWTLRVHKVRGAAGTLTATARVQPVGT